VQQKSFLVKILTNKENKMQYPLEEKIGNPDLLVGREQEFASFDKWISNMPKKLSKSWALLGRRKSGKTAFVQRLFNKLWSANGQVVPFYISIPDKPIWLVDLAVKYYETFASQYISFLERNIAPVSQHLKLEEIKDYGKANKLSSLVKDVDYITEYIEKRLYGVVWDRIYRAPHKMASLYDRRILVMIDEFQYLSSHVYSREDLSGKPIEGMPGSFHEVSESKIAPMLATGSYVGWMVDIMGKYLEAGRLSHIEFSPYLTESEGLQAVYKYAENCNEALSNETAAQINELCMADPFFISCVIQSSFSGKDLTDSEGIIETVNYEIAGRRSELSGTWREYIDKTVDRINDRNGKKILLHLSKYNDRFWTPRELREELKLEQDEKEIHRKLISMVRGDLIEWGVADIDFRGLQDGTLNLILRHRFEKEIAEHQAPPDLRIDFRKKIAGLKKENNILRGKLNQITGVVAEYQFATALRSRKRFNLGEFFNSSSDIFDRAVNIQDVRIEVFIQREDGKNLELDLIAESNDDSVLLVEIKKRKAKTGINDIEDFLEKMELYKSLNPEQIVFAGFLSLGGFTDEALQMCEQNCIGWAEEFSYF
jgi:hypothetical protein